VRQAAFTHGNQAKTARGVSIVNVSSLASVYGLQMSMWIMPAKQRGGRSLSSKGFALEVANDGIRVKRRSTRFDLHSIARRGGEAGRVDRIGPICH